MQDELAGYLDTLEQGDCYRVDDVLKEGAHERTERVYLIRVDGSEHGPYIRKRILENSGLGEAYGRIWQAQQDGRRFLHLPRIIECSSGNGCRTVIMEYVAGKTLDEAVIEKEHSQEFALRVFGPLCDAVMELHERFAPPLIHRDLKPSNIIVSPGNLTIIDFGIARTFDEESSRDTVRFGTRGYAPPEQYGFGQTDERSDVYALGMLFAFCLLGEEPDRLLVDSGFNDNRIPEEFRTILTKATAFDPQARYASVRDLRAAISIVRQHIEDAGARERYVSRHTADGVPVPPLPEGVQFPPPPQGAQPIPIAPKRTEMRKAKRPSPLSRIPRWVGAIWDIAIVAVWFCLLAFSVYRTFVPFDTMLDHPIAIRAIDYFGISTVGVAFLLYLLLDKRPLREHSPFFANLARWKERLVCLCVGFGLPLICLLIDYFYMLLTAG